MNNSVILWENLDIWLCMKFDGTKTGMKIFTYIKFIAWNRTWCIFFCHYHLPYIHLYLVLYAHNPTAHLLYVQFCFLAFLPSSPPVSVYVAEAFYQEAQFPTELLLMKAAGIIVHHTANQSLTTLHEKWMCIKKKSLFFFSKVKLV